MAIKYTTPFNLPYPDIDDPVRNGQAAIEGIAKGVNTALQNANIPPGNPELNAVLARLNELETKSATLRPSCSGVTPPATVAAGSWTSQQITFPPGLFTAPPRVVVSGSDGKITCSFNPSLITKDGGTIFGESRATTPLDNIRLTWIAIQP